MQKYSICEDNYIFKEHKFSFKSLLNFPFPHSLTKMKFGFSRSHPELREWFLVFPVPVPNYGNGFLYFPFPSRTPGKIFWFSRSRPIMQKVIPSHAWGLPHQVINRPGVAGAVLQTASWFIHWFINSVSHPFPPDIHNIINPKPLELDSWNVERVG